MPLHNPGTQRLKVTLSGGQDQKHTGYDPLNVLTLNHDFMFWPQQWPHDYLPSIITVHVQGLQEDLDEGSDTGQVQTHSSGWDSHSKFCVCHMDMADDRTLLKRRHKKKAYPLCPVSALMMADNQK
jgi:hypothetical protein